MQHINQIIILFQLGSGRHILRQKDLSLAHMPPKLTLTGCFGFSMAKHNPDQLRIPQREEGISARKKTCL